MTRCKAKPGLKGSGATTKMLSETTKRQMLLKQMAKDPTVETPWTQSQEKCQCLKLNVAMAMDDLLIYETANGEMPPKLC
jgi:hypothetical protein